MLYYYDNYGWLSATPIVGRSTEVVPMAAEGNMKPNFTGYKWMLTEYVEPSVAFAFENKATATDILASTDWTALPSVGDSLQSNPYLVNQEEWITFRSRVRNIAVNPVDGDLDWTPPQELWSN